MNKNKLILVIVSLTSSALLILIYFSILPFGKILNLFLQCNEIQENSFPCYGIYDIFMMIFLGCVTIGCLINYLINIYKLKKS